MKLTLLGELLVNSKMVISDPCYTLKDKASAQISLKPGNYDVYLITGKPKNPFMSWDTDPYTFRNAELTIIHQNYNKDLDFKKLTSLSIDSGNMGIFNLDNYQKDLDQPLELKNKQISFYREELVSARLKYKKHLKESKSTDNDNFKNVLKMFKNDKKKAIEFIKNSLAMDKSGIEYLKEIIRKKNFDIYKDELFSKEFYEIVCDQAHSNIRAGIIEPYGVVSTTGYGDGSADVLVAKNDKNEVISVQLQFMSLEELK